MKNLVKKFWNAPAINQAAVLIVCGLTGFVLTALSRIWIPETRTLNFIMGSFGFLIGCGALRMFAVPAPSGDEKMWRWPIYGSFTWLALISFGGIIEANLDNYGLTLGNVFSWIQGIIAIIAVIGIVYCVIVSTIRERQHA